MFTNNLGLQELITLARTITATATFIRVSISAAHRRLPTTVVPKSRRRFEAPSAGVLRIAAAQLSYAVA